MAMIADAFVSNLCEILLTSAIEEAAKILGVPNEIKKLRRRLELMQGVLADAENRRFENQTINRWLNQLRDLVYDADDIIDECWIEGEMLLSSNSSSSRCVEWVRRCYPTIAFLHKVGFRCKIGKRIRGLNLKLDELAKDETFLHLPRTPHDAYHTSTISRRTSPIVEPEVVGDKIENDTGILVDLLTKEHKKNFPIFAIVGMGGIGKTALAQKIFNNEKLRDNFNQMPRIWLCVSQDFSESELLRSIIEQAGGNPGEAKKKEVLEPMLRHLIANKKFFLILDDVWDARVWDDLLRKPLQSGLPDSRILITSRHEAIARQMGAEDIHRVEKLSEEDGWSLICSMIFKECEKGDMHVLSDIGMRIVKKCDGLPLALRTVGGILRTKKKRQSEWEKVLSSPAWSFTAKLPKEEMGPLFLSYLDLPPPLKQCFTYFSLVAEDYLVKQSVFARHVIAEGCATSEDNTSLEDVMEEYWKELVQRNLLQPDPNWYDEGCCRMHDLLRSLAQHIAQDECFFGDAQTIERKIKASSSSSSTKLRRLSIVDEKVETIPDLIMEQTSLRTLLFFRTPLIHDLPEDLFRKLRSLRVLDFNKTAINNLPTSLGDLVHLRSLDISYTPIREIPESIGNLRNLQFLMLHNCEYLHSLPSGVLGLINLRTLNAEDTPLNGIPTGIGRLQQLNQLEGFVSNGSEGRRFRVGGDDREQEHKEHHEDGRFCTLEELKSLSQLRLTSLFKLERISSRAEARAATLQAKPRLLHLFMHCTLPNSSSDVQQPRTNVYEEKEIKRIGEVFEELCPPPCLEELEIKGYFGREFPSWMMTPSLSSLRNLRRVVLENCALCQKLPALGILPQLDYLRIKGASAVMRIGPEFLSLASGRKTDSFFSTYFPKLEMLHFEKMPDWEEWWWGWEGGGSQTTSLLPCLKVLSIDECPKLRSLPESLCHATALKKLEILNAHSLREVQNLRSLTKLILISNSILERVSNFPALKHLDVYDCEELKGVEGVDAVEHIKLDDREAEESLPEWLVGAGEEQPRFPSLHKLTLANKVWRRGLPDWPPI